MNSCLCVQDVARLVHLVIKHQIWKKGFLIDMFNKTEINICCYSDFITCSKRLFFRDSFRETLTIVCFFVTDVFLFVGLRSSLHFRSPLMCSFLSRLLSLSI